jgi:hypothetical protein
MGKQAILTSGVPRDFHRSPPGTLRAQRSGVQRRWKISENQRSSCHALPICYNGEGMDVSPCRAPPVGSGIFNSHPKPQLEVVLEDAKKRRLPPAFYDGITTVTGARMPSRSRGGWAVLHSRSSQASAGAMLPSLCADGDCEYWAGGCGSGPSLLSGAYLSCGAAQHDPTHCGRWYRRLRSDACGTPS